jgi:uncharacterized protein (TIGR00730 family)
MQRVCVFCGSKVGNAPMYRDAAERLGGVLVARGLELVYGGGSVGLMGVLADTVLAAGGAVTGVIPGMLATEELLHPRVKDMHVMPSMHARKARMEELSDAFIALPGGYGTFEELLEIVTWAQLGIHNKPVGILDVGGYFKPLLVFLDHAVEEGFIKVTHRELLCSASQPESLLDALAARRLPAPHGKLKREQT